MWVSGTRNAKAASSHSTSSTFLQVACGCGIGSRLTTGTRTSPPTSPKSPSRWKTATPETGWRRQGAPKVALWVDPDNDRARHRYEKFGFKDVEGEDDVMVVDVEDFTA